MSKAASTVLKKSGVRQSQQIQWFLMVLPWMLIVFVFAYIPLAGWSMAFMEYKPAPGIAGFLKSRFVGLDQFINLFQDENFYISLRNTLGISVLKLVFNFASAIFLALMLNEVRNMLFKRVVQTISYLPYFISWVVAANIVYLVLAPQGIVNQILVALHLVQQPVPFMGQQSTFWLVLALSNVWKTVGYGAIIYLSAMTSIDPELYESAAIDGAGRLRRIVSITLPSIMPMIKILLVLNLGWLMSAGFDQVFLMSNPSVEPVSRTIELYVYNYALKYSRFSYGTAIGIFNSIISIILVLSANFLSKKIDGEGVI